MSDEYPEVTTGSIAARENREAMQRKAQSEFAAPAGSEAWPTQHSCNRFEYRTLNGEWQVYGNGLLHVCMCNCESTADMITRALNRQMPQNE